MNVVARAVQAVWNPQVIRVRGNEFEYFIREKLFPENKYALLQKNCDVLAKNNLIEDSESPDFQFRSRSKGFTFYIEAKHRYGFYGGAIEWCQPSDLKRYHEIDSNVPLYVVLGLGLLPLAPQQLFLFRVNSIYSTGLSRAELLKYKISPKHSIPEKALLKLG